MANENLINKLVEETGCDCLSDLRLQLNDWIDAIMNALSIINVKDYTIGEWKEVISYLADVKLDLSTYENPQQYACEYLIEFLKSKRD